MLILCSIITEEGDTSRQPNTECESDKEGKSRHSEGLRDLHRRPDLHIQGQGSAEHRTVGAVFTRGSGAGPQGGESTEPHGDVSEGG